MTMLNQLSMPQAGSCLPAQPLLACKPSFKPSCRHTCHRQHARERAAPAGAVGWPELCCPENFGGPEGKWKSCGFWGCEPALGAAAAEGVEVGNPALYGWSKAPEPCTVPLFKSPPIIVQQGDTAVCNNSCMASSWRPQRPWSASLLQSGGVGSHARLLA